MNKMKIRNWFGRFGTITLALICCGVIALVFALNTSKVEKEKTEVTTDVVRFGLPMSDAVVVKDYADDRLQYNKSLNRWEIHLAVDLASEKSDVYCVSDGVVTSVESNALDGYIIKISHNDGFASVYSSLSDVSLKVGDEVVRGQKIAKASSTATNESADGSHLHLVLLKNGKEVDPNLYIDLQNK